MSSMAAKMLGDVVIVTSAVDGSSAEAILLGCSSCKCTEFAALLFGSNKDLHLQCLRCGESHCAHDSECNLPLSNGVTR